MLLTGCWPVCYWWLNLRWRSGRAEAQTSKLYQWRSRWIISSGIAAGQRSQDKARRYSLTRKAVNKEWWRKWTCWGWALVGDKYDIFDILWFVQRVRLDSLTITGALQSWWIIEWQKWTHAVFSDFTRCCYSCNATRVPGCHPWIHLPDL